MIDRVNLFHPRRAAIAAALEVAFPMPGKDGEAKAGRRLLRRMDLGAAVRAVPPGEPTK